MPSVKRPNGRDEVRAAVLEAAARRFAAEGPDASLRDIADDAGVNLGLIHRHLGNKDDLMRAVLASEIERGVGTIEEAGDVASALRRLFLGAVSDGRYIRIVAWLLLHDPTQLRHQDRFPGHAGPAIAGRRWRRPRPRSARGRRRPARAGDGPFPAAADERDAGLMVAMAAIFGWTVFGPQLRAAFGHEATDRAALEALLAETVAAIVEPPA